MQDYKKLRVWHLAHGLSIQVIRAMTPEVGRKVPGLRGQAIKAATSVPWNIVEGCGCSSRKEFLSFVEQAIMSANELEGQLLTARDSDVFTPSVDQRLQASTVLTRKMLISFADALRLRIAEEERNERRDLPESGDAAD